ncbi:hypothetical protein ACWD4V_25310 [Streptomyces tsukubensis]|uniref:hypothetical protein n=1 Tax=Streptomyces tsukubensis TaxID=83656 RepID=UPI0036C55AE2
MEPRISILLSAFEALLAVGFLVHAFQTRADGGSATPWFVFGGLLLATSLFTLTRGLRRLRRKAP